MLPQPLLAPALTFIFAKMMTMHNCTIGAWKRRFIEEMFHVLIAMRGRVNFTNMARYSTFCEQTFRRHFQKAFGWVAFNLVLLRLRRHPQEPLIGVFDCSFLPKSGTETWGLDRFFSSTAGRNRRGLEVSVLGAIATKSRQALGLDATQTPPGLATDRASGYTRIDVYREQLLDLARRLEKADVGISCWVGDGYYAKKKMFAAVDRIGSHLITRLRSDANLRYLYTGPPTGTQGPEKQYDGKIRWNDREQLAERFEEVGRLPGRSEIRILTTVANSPHFGRDFRVVLLLGPDDHVVLCSTDTTRPAEQIAAYYRLRYQIEFVIRDAKQHAGLTHCQARSQEKIDFHLNASLATVGLLRLLTHQTGQSLHTYRREAYNRMLIDRLLSKLGLCAEFDRSDPRLQEVVRTGRMVA